MFRAVCCVCLLVLLGGCSTYLDDYQYTPRPAVSPLPATQPTQPPPANVLATIIGVRYNDPDDHIPSSVEIRLRIDNNGPYAIVFDPNSMTLTNGQLVGFSAPIVSPAQPFSLQPQQSTAVSAFFPFPLGHSYDDTDLETLQLRWVLQMQGVRYGQTANFARVRYYYYNYSPYYYYPPPYPVVGYGAVVVVHSRW